MSDPTPSRLSIFVAVIKVALRTRRIRRQIMFALTIAMMLIVFVGAYPCAGFLAARPGFFLFFWTFSLLLVITVILLTLYDMLMVSREERDDLETILRRSSTSKRNDDEPPQPPGK